MAPRANWKGFLKLGELSCGVALYTAASTSERIAFHTLNRETGNRVHREFVDSDTGKPVEREDQVKGYEVTDGDYVILEPEEVAAAVPEADKMLNVETFIRCDDIDDVYFDKPYYLVPSDKQSLEVFALIRDGLKKKKMAAIAETVLFRRVRTLLIRPYDKGMIASTLNFNYEVRSAEEAFEDAPKLEIKCEMLELAAHIIDTKMGKFDPAAFDDRYEAALADMVKAKIEGRKIKPRPAPEPTKVVDLMEALRQSAGGKTGKAKSGAKPSSASKAPRKTVAKTTRAKATNAKPAAVKKAG